MPTREREIIETSIKAATQRRGAAITGASFKQILAKNGIEFPPGKFSAYLSDYSDVVSIIERESQDFLVIPKDGIQLLSETARSLKLRNDFYRAFTRVEPAKKAYYDDQNDSIEWYPTDATDIPPHLITIPGRSEEDEIKVRSRFTDELPVEETKHALGEALRTQFPLSSYSREIRRLHLIERWYNFRLKHVIEDVRNWASAAGIQFRQSWIAGKEFSSPARSSSNTAETQLIDMLKKLEPTDLSRITVPLDIVLKILGK